MFLHLGELEMRGGNNGIVNDAFHLYIHLPVVYLSLSLACSSSTSDPSSIPTLCVLDANTAPPITGHYLSKDQNLLEDS